ncbi:hypothetical protein SUGI_1501090, partial [Cryptomeria japonica]
PEEVDVGGESTAKHTSLGHALRDRPPTLLVGDTREVPIGLMCTLVEGKPRLERMSVCNHRKDWVGYSVGPTNREPYSAHDSGKAHFETAWINQMERRINQISGDHQLRAGEPLSFRDNPDPSFYVQFRFTTPKLEGRQRRIVCGETHLFYLLPPTPGGNFYCKQLRNGLSGF